MTKQSKGKVEVFLVETIKKRFEMVCENKGISNAEGLRRAIERWLEDNEK